MKNEEVKGRFPWRTVAATPDEISFPVKGLAWNGTGTGVETLVNGVYGYTLPPGASIGGRAPISIPPNWAGRTATVEIAWCPGNSGTGNVYYDLVLRRIYDGGSVDVWGAVPTVVDPSPANSAVASVASLTLTLPPAINEREFINLQLRRRGDVGTIDTYAGTAFLLGMKFRVR